MEPRVCHLRAPEPAASTSPPPPHPQLFDRVTNARDTRVRNTLPEIGASARPTPPDADANGGGSRAGGVQDVAHRCPDQLRQPHVLGVGSSSDGTSSSAYVPRGKYPVVFVLVLVASAAVALILALFEVTFEKVSKARTLRTTTGAGNAELHEPCGVSGVGGGAAGAVLEPAATEAEV